MSFWTSVLGQFSNLPYPNEDCTGRTVIVTGANVGKFPGSHTSKRRSRAARHFVRLNAGKVILACRSVDKGEAAVRDIEASDPSGRRGVVDAWQLDLSSFDSVRAFAARAAALDRLDALVNNASVLTVAWATAEDHELMVTVNVLSTFLLTVMLLPALRRTAAKFNIMPHVVIVSSDGAFLVRPPPFPRRSSTVNSDTRHQKLMLASFATAQTSFPEKKADHILNRLKVNQNYTERYNTTKLLQLMLMRRLAAAIDASQKGRVVVNSLNPGFCNTQLFRSVPFPFNLFFAPALALVARSPEMGSRTLMTAAFAGEDTHGQWMANCKPHGWPAAMTGDEADRVMDKLWDELTETLEGIEPGVMNNI
ncbi:hypothetical protein HIM_05030 [Hirsutella minnesotensis 3608]|uniref:Ketoreductase (KR) domain-containing protein n=1 Tax=Hirsutella minnesotensis 3608 TaxID=1043627 RepID=A0A0F8A0S0_9HYPO|nr:hypothetical protein HIM_05030 [Hirsutella minnesotensis 3608]